MGGSNGRQLRCCGNETAREFKDDKSRAILGNLEK